MVVVRKMILMNKYQDTFLGIKRCDKCDMNFEAMSHLLSHPFIPIVTGVTWV